jgi:site-specific DNA-methyltransferase (adenine-specific)
MIIHGDCLDVLRGLAANSIDAVVTDPPYGLSFMGKAWDYDVPTAEVWREVLRVLKPGGHLLSFFGTRTQHRGVCAIEDGGFEIRDSLVWMYGTGFPKSYNVSKAIDAALGSHRAEELAGWGTALKPAHEPIVLARKPLLGTVAENAHRWATGGLNIDGCRIGVGEPVPGGGKSRRGFGGVYGDGEAAANAAPHTDGRWPANVCLDEEAARLLDEQSGESKSTKLNTVQQARGPQSKGAEKARVRIDEGYLDSGGASRFFYVAKPGRKERDAGCEALPAKTGGEATDREDGSRGTENPRAGAGRTGGAKNFHPTVKPIALMRWLVRLVTPPGGTVLDPFTGSGTTGIAALEEGFKFFGIERDADYCEIAKARIGAVGI